MQEPVAKTRSERKHVWQVDHYCHCTLVGVCLSVPEQRKVMQGQDIKKLSAYEMHAWLVSLCKQQNPISSRLERSLNVKYAKDIKLIGSLSVEQVRQHWQDCLEAGEIAGAYWAILSRWDTTAELQARLFGDVHMLSHQNVSLKRNARHEIETLGQECRRLSERLQREAALRREVQAENERLRAALEVRQVAVAPVCARPEESCQQFAVLKRKVEHQQQLIEAQRQYRKDNQMLIRELEALRAINAELGQRIACLSAATEQTACSVDCPAFDTCARRVLLVGGITKMSAHYREVVVQCGCEFEHHDGYLRDGEKVLEGKISRCDIVICPVDVNSHNACLCVKKICKRLNKPYRMLSSSSLSAVARSLSAEV